MLIVDQHAAIRHAYYNQDKSIREIGRELQISRQSVRKALASPAPVPYTQTVPRAGVNFQALWIRFETTCWILSESKGNLGRSCSGEK